jgi:hypothetical protein
VRVFLIRILLKLSWSVGRARVRGFARLRSTDLGPLFEVAQPGDAVLMGNNGELSHVAVYAGQGEIIHAMATEKTMLGWWGSLVDGLRRAFGGQEAFVGVVRESLGGFVDRYDRDAWVLMRARGMSLADRDRAMAKVESLVGHPYDYGFQAGNEAWYCTELVEVFLTEAQGRAPVIRKTRAYVPLLMDEEVMEPVALLDTDGLVAVSANDAARAVYGAKVTSPGDPV